MHFFDRTVIGILAGFLSIGLTGLGQETPGLVSGTVINASTKAPFANVLVMMSGGGVTRTDDLGRFELKNVTPGTWTIQALRTGTAPPPGETSPRTLTVLPGEQIRNVVLRLAELGTLRGRITDEEGKPQASVLVQALQVSYQQGRRILTRPTTDMGTTLAMTDVKGEYELQIPPGKYFIGADYTPRGEPSVISTQFSDLGTMTTRTYYPGTLDPALAATVVLTGADSIPADFAVVKRKPDPVKVSGVVIGGTSELAADTNFTRSFQFVPRDVSGFDAPVTIPDIRRIGLPNSQFEVRSVPRGFFDLVITDTMADGQRGDGIVPIEVRDRNIEGLKVVLQPRRDIEGKVVVRGASNLIPMEQIAIRGGGPAVMAAVDGTFKLQAVQAGARSIRVDGLPVNAYVADIRQGSVSLFDAARTLSGPQYVAGEFAEALEITVSSNGGEIQGFVEASGQQNVSGAVVVLVPGPTRRFVQSYYRSAVVASTGQFTFQGIAPGTYQLYAWESVPNTAWMNPDFLASNEGRGQTINIEAGVHKAAHVRLIPRED